MAFIANFMLKNKDSMKKLEEMIEVHPQEIEEVTNIEQEDDDENQQMNEKLVM
jgi:hypothetical protein